MAQRATDRKKREREESRPVLEAFASAVDVSNPTALSSFLSAFALEAPLTGLSSNPSSSSPHAIANKKRGAAATEGSPFTTVASCVTLPTSGGDELPIPEALVITSATANNNASNTYMKIDFDNIKRLCEKVNLEPLALKKALLAYCPRAVLFERDTLQRVADTKEAGASTINDNDRIDTCNDDAAAAGTHAADVLLPPAIDDNNGAGDDALSPAERKATRFDKLPWSTNVGDLCFVLLSVAAPSDVRERRRLDGASATMAALCNGASDDPNVPALIRHFRRLFSEHFGSASAATKSEDDGDNVNHSDHSPVKESGDDEADKFFSCLTEPLPMALRLHRTEPALYAMAKHFLNRRQTSEGVNGLGAVVKPVEWLSGDSGFDKSNAHSSNKYICESYSCSHDDYHANPNVMAVCKTLHSSGALSFQELVSVIPVLGLGVKGHHRVLDMCAAPGSKTLLAVDMAFADARGSPTGMIWANEKDHTKAMQTLPARMKRHHAPNVVTTKCDATTLPMMFRTANVEAGVGVVPVRFDRIICDVPCSGDGTVRKERSLIGTWSERYIDSLVPTQVRLLRRGLELLEEGGVLAYSTCSLNPKEDEEVLFEVLKNYAPDSIQLISVREALRDIYDGKLNLSTFPTSNGIRVTPTHPSSESPHFRGHRSQDLPALADAIASSVLRVMPHTHNTGGFFVALIKKITHTSPASQLPPHVATKLNNWTGHKRYKVLDIARTREGGENTQEEGEHAELWRDVCEFYGIPINPHLSSSSSSPSSSSPSSPASAAVPLVGVPTGDTTTINNSQASAISLPYFYQLVPAAFLNPDGTGQIKRIQLLTPVAADWLSRVRPYKGPSVELVLGGTRAFELYDGTYLANASCRWRVASESANIVARVATRRKMIFDLNCATPEVKAFLKELFLRGFVFLEHQPTTDSIEDSKAATTKDEGMRFHESVEALLSPFRMDDSGGAWFVGGVLIGIRGGLKAFENPNAATTEGDEEGNLTWWLCGTLSGKKLELTVDVSNRALGLTTYFGLLDPFQGSKTVPSIPLEEQ